ncbi:ATP-dependent DNA helicase [Lachnospira multipara]|uniref:ATP-dependent DNA helicase n=1 Tax=Lachnospira multipara TaxID=28051 RepID=UPI0004E238EA|nr:ATP-dependent DNA helicase [Lachnospira multipara]
MYVIVKNVLRISVRNLVEFLCTTGNIDRRSTGITDVRAMQEGARIHRKIQHEAGASYHAEVPLKMDFNMVTDNANPYVISIEGRADGIIADMYEDEDGNKTPIGAVTVDEIKTMQYGITKLKEAVYVHKAQALVYAYIYATKNNLDSIIVQMTYCNPETEFIKRFVEEYTYEDLSKWFNDLLDEFKKWTDFLLDERAKRNESIRNLEFPFEYRKGQKQIVSAVYKTIEKSENMYIQAPTGVGKTISTLYPTIQAVGRGMLDKIFYLTSKTITRTVAESTYKILKDKGLSFRSITLTAKEKICPLDEMECNPEVCPYAKGHFDRVNDAVYDMITHETNITRDVVLEYAKEQTVCPFEMELDASYWCDGIICDYNYVFDPDACLKRYFAEGSKGDYGILVDEAHNLVDRARSMYSARLIKEDFLEVKKLFKDPSDKKIVSAINKCNKELLELKKEARGFAKMSSFGKFSVSLERLGSLLSKYLEKQKGKPVFPEVLDFFFDIRHFLSMEDVADEKYVRYVEEDERGNFVVNLSCIDPSGNISLRLGQAKSAVFFSATLLPINYYKEMITGDVHDMAIYANSPFDTEKRKVIIAADVSSRYSRRNDNEYRKICEYIDALVKTKRGNYIVFFPSFSFMEKVYLKYSSEFINPFDESVEVIMQTGKMTEGEREEFLSNFTSRENSLNNVTFAFSLSDGQITDSIKLEDKFDRANLRTNIKSLVGFCVLGGIFSEGIDLKEDSLIGTAIVGTGIPMICRSRDIIRDYFNQIGKDGYSYAYVYPGMNKVLQAAGRVIRTANDEGIILLLDDRFLTPEYERLFPREWDKIYKVTKNGIVSSIRDFWDL